MKTVRNAIGHISKDSEDKFMALVRRKVVNFPLGITPGQFLGISSVNINMPHIAQYAEALRIAADRIIQ